MSFTGKVGAQICPAYAGMILKRVSNRVKEGDLSRVCGDDPTLEEIETWDEIFVPRMRG